VKERARGTPPPSVFSGARPAKKKEGGGQGKGKGEKHGRGGKEKGRTVTFCSSPAPREGRHKTQKGAPFRKNCISKAKPPPLQKKKPYSHEKKEEGPGAGPACVARAGVRHRRPSGKKKEGRNKGTEEPSCAVHPALDQTGGRGETEKKGEKRGGLSG